MEIDTDNEFSECPYCGSTNISANSFDYESMSIEEICFDCHREWCSIYSFSGVYIPEECEEAYNERQRSIGSIVGKD